MTTPVLAPIASFAPKVALSAERAQHNRQVAVMTKVDAAGLDGLRASTVARDLYAAAKDAAADIARIGRNQQLSQSGKHEQTAAVYQKMRETMETLGTGWIALIAKAESAIHRVLGPTLDSEGFTPEARYGALVSLLQWKDRAAGDAIAHLEELTARGDVAGLRAVLPLAKRDVDFTKRFQGTPNSQLRDAIAAGELAAVSDFALGKQYADEQIEKMSDAVRRYVAMLLDFRGSDPLMDPDRSASIQMLLQPFSATP